MSITEKSFDRLVGGSSGSSSGLVLLSVSLLVVCGCLGLAVGDLGLIRLADGDVVRRVEWFDAPLG
jgi:hypothetical protein